MKKNKSHINDTKEVHEHWEVNLNAMPEGEPNTPEGAFLPMSGKHRPQPHKKINELDH